MKKIVYFLLIALCLPLGLRAQSADDDLYFIPSKDKKEKKETQVKKEPKKQVTTNIYTSPGTTVVIQDRKGKTRDVDEYNRRYDAQDNEFEMDHDTLYNDTLYIKEKKNSDLDGEWVNGEFDGSQEDYEYAERIIRFRNPRFAVSINSPLYWDMVYGANSWDWNVYTDGFYAYAFPTFGNSYWWDWRYNSYGSGWNYGWGWNNGWGWDRPYCGWGYYPGYYGSYWGGWYGGGSWGHHHHWGGGPSWGGVSRPYYSGRSVLNANNRARYSSGSSYNRRGEGSRGSYQGTGDRGTSNGRVVGTRNTNSRVEGLSGNRGEASRRGSSTYSRPSSTGTRNNTSTSTGESSTYRRSSSTETRRNSSYTRGSSSSSRESSTYSRGSSSPSSRGSSTYSRGSSSSSRSSSTYSPSSSSRSSSPSYTPSRSSSPSYSGSSSSGSSRSSGSSSSGGSSRSSGGGSSRSSGGGSRR